jgi:hypothetical protein
MLLKAPAQQCAPGRPLSRVRNGWLDGTLMQYETLLPPLSPDDRTIDMLLIGIVPYGREQAKTAE